MLDNLLNLVRKNAGDAVENNPAIPNEKNEAAVQDAGNSIENTLKSALAAGKFEDVLAFFKSGNANPDTPIVHDATVNYANDLQKNYGLEATKAQEIANKVVPSTMNDLASKTNDPNDKSFNIQDIFNNLTGGKTSGFNMEKMLNKFTGGKLDKDGDGDVDFNDLKNLFAGGGAGGVMDKVKGMFK